MEVYDKLNYLSFAARPRGRFALPVVDGFDRHAVLALPKNAEGNLDLSRLPARTPGYTREAKRKIVVTEDDARAAIRLRDEARQKLQDKLRDIANDQADVLKPKKK